MTKPRKTTAEGPATRMSCAHPNHAGGQCPKPVKYSKGYREIFPGPLCANHYRLVREAHTPVCKEPGCSAEAFHYGRCRPHEHLPLRRLSPEKLADVRQQVLDVIEPDLVTGCWIFNQATINGYGRINAKHGVGQWLAHRLAYHLWFDGHANGSELDHLCAALRSDSSLCLSPFHLNPATPKANTRLRDIRAENPDFPWHISREGVEVDPPSWPMGLVLFAMINGLPAGLPGGELHEQTSAAVGQGIEDAPPF